MLTAQAGVLKSGRTEKSLRSLSYPRCNTVQVDMACKPSMKEEYERRKIAEKNAHDIVEKLIEEDVEKDQFISWLKLITGQHYSDVVEERSLSDLCGYCLCNNTLKEIPKQQYKINKNKVYDITERKKFCSNRCYAISCNILEQISSTPLWLRKPDLMPDVRIPDIDNSTAKSAGGKQIHLTHIITRKELNSLDCNDEQEESDSNTQLNSTCVNPTTFPKQHSKIEKTPAVSEKSDNKKPRSINIADEVFDIIQQWITTSTQEYLEIIESRNQDVPGNSDIQEKEMILQKQLDKLIIGESFTKEPSKPVPDYRILKDEVNHFNDRVSSFYEGSLHVKEKQHKKTKQATSSEKEEQVELVLPTIDSKNQNAIRQKIVLDHIKKIIDDLTPPLPNVMQQCCQLVKTFSFSSTNVMLSVELWPVMTLVLLHLSSVKNTNLRECLHSPTMRKFCEILLKPCGLTQQLFEMKVLDIIRNLN